MWGELEQDESFSPGQGGKLEKRRMVALLPLWLLCTLLQKEII